MRRRGPRALRSMGDLLHGALPEGAEEKLAFPRVREEWEAVVGPALARRSLPVEIDEGVLFVRAETPTAAKALSMRGGTVARALSERTGLTVTSLKVTVGSVRAPTQPARRRPVRVTPPKDAVDEELERIRGSFPPGQEETARRLASLMALYRVRFPGR